MKKIASWIIFVLTVVIFIFDIYFTVYGTIDIKNQFERLAARGASGHEYLEVGLDVLVIGIVLISVVGAIISIVSSKIAQSRVIRIISFVLYILFVLLIFSCFCIPYL